MIKQGNIITIHVKHTDASLYRYQGRPYLMIACPSSYHHTPNPQIIDSRGIGIRIQGIGVELLNSLGSIFEASSRQ